MDPKFSTVKFRHHQLLCLEQDDQIWVAMRPVVEGMGLAWQVQQRKLNASTDRFCVTIMVTQVPGDDQSREHLFIPLERLFGWLMTIHPNKVAPEIRAEVIAYQKECDRVLAQHFMHELREEVSWVWRIHWDYMEVLHEGWYRRFPHWKQIYEDAVHGVPRAATAADLGCSVSTITRNRRRIAEAGLFHISSVEGPASTDAGSLH
jgi:hypothetical protein